MKRRITFFGRLAAGLLTVLLALPQSAWADCGTWDGNWQTYDKTTRTVTTCVTAKLGEINAVTGALLHMYDNPASSDSSVLIVGGEGGYLYGYATMGVGTAIATYTTSMSEYHKITESEYNAYKEDKVKPAGWNEYSEDCIKSSRDDDFYGIQKILLSHGLRSHLECNRVLDCK